MDISCIVAISGGSKPELGITIEVQLRPVRAKLIAKYVTLDKFPAIMGKADEYCRIGIKCGCLGFCTKITKGFRMRKLMASFIVFLFFSPIANADNGLISIKSAHGVSATADRLENILKEKGMTVFIRINHTDGASRVGKTLRPTELIVFGNPKVGTPLMQCAQSVAIDLPQKALIWEDENGQVWLSYNDPGYLAKRHTIQNCDEVLNKIRGALSKFSDAATTE